VPVRERVVCGTGSVKSQVGHTKAAADSGGFDQDAMAHHHKYCRRRKTDGRWAPGWDSPFYLNTEADPVGQNWPPARP
jgi:acyl transferase domain-containing protein